MGMHGGVVVDGVDHIAEQVGGAPVGRAEGQRVVQPLPALAGEDREQRDERQRQQDQGRMLRDVGRDGQRGTRQARVGQIQPRHLRLRSRRHPVGKPGPRQPGGGVDHELRHQREDQPRGSLPREHLVARQHEHEHRPERIRSCRRCGSPRGTCRPARAPDRADRSATRAPGAPPVAPTASAGRTALARTQAGSAPSRRCPPRIGSPRHEIRDDGEGEWDGGERLLGVRRRRQCGRDRQERERRRPLGDQSTAPGDRFIEALLSAEQQALRARRRVGVQHRR